jgi:hypothetical protein
MKAEHRKELQTNVLADRMGKFLQGASSTSGAVWALLGIVIVVGVAYWWWTTRAANRISAAWIDYWDHRQSAESLEDVMQREKGTAAERAARLSRADFLYDEGYKALFTAKGPQGAKAHFEEAARIYKELGDNPGDSREVTIRALIGQAKAHESLASLGKEGSLEEARRLYELIHEKYGQEPRGPLVQAAEERLEMLKGQGNKEALAFYQKWHGSLARIEETPKPPEPKAPEKAPEPKTTEKTPETKAPEASAAKTPEK